MGLIPRDFIDDLVQRVDIVEVIHARVPLKKKGAEYAACCPFHDEKTPSFYVSPAKQFYHCFGCGVHGTALGFLMDYEHMGFVEAVEELARKLGVEVPREGGDAAPRKRTDPDLYEMLEHAADYYRERLRESDTAVEYLKGRGLSGEIARSFGIGYAPPGWDNLLKALGAGDPERIRRLAAAGLVIEKDDSKRYDRFRNRVMFPIRDARGRTIAFGGRVIDPEDEPKYLNSPETDVFHKGRELYGLHEARQALREVPRLLVVEGYMDVVALAQHGIRYAVATLGTATTTEHLKRLFRVASEVVFCFDGDTAGRAAAWRALEHALPEAKEGRQMRFLFLPEGEDPDSLVQSEGAEAFERRLDSATPLSEFLLAHLEAQTDTATMDGRARLVELARPLVSRVPDGAFRLMLVEQLARRARMDPERLEGLLDPAAAPDRPGPPRRPGGLRPPRMSTMRTAIQLLIHRPALAEHAGDPERIAALDIAGSDLLAEMVDWLQTHPGMTTATVLEHWRDSPHFKALDKLSGIAPLVDEAGMEPEFRDLIDRLVGRDRRTRAQRRCDALAAKGFANLSEAEKSEFRALQRELKS